MPPDRQLSGEIGAKITLTSNTAGGSQFFDPWHCEGHNFLCLCKGRVIAFRSYNISEFQNDGNVESRSVYHEKIPALGGVNSENCLNFTYSHAFY